MTLYEAMLMTSIATTTYDVETTFRTLDQCAACREANPIMRPFVGHRATAYAVQAGFTTATAYSAWELKKKGSKWFWVPMAASIGLHIVAGIHNTRLGNEANGSCGAKVRPVHCN